MGDSDSAHRVRVCAGCLAGVGCESRGGSGGGSVGYLVAAAYNLVRMGKLLSCQPIRAVQIV